MHPQGRHDARRPLGRQSYVLLSTVLCKVMVLGLVLLVPYILVLVLVLALVLALVLVVIGNGNGPLLLTALHYPR